MPRGMQASRGGGATRGGIESSYMHIAALKIPHVRLISTSSLTDTRSSPVCDFFFFGNVKVKDEEKSSCLPHPPSHVYYGRRAGRGGKRKMLLGWGGLDFHLSLGRRKRGKTGGGRGKKSCLLATSGCLQGPEGKKKDRTFKEKKSRRKSLSLSLSLSPWPLTNCAGPRWSERASLPPPLPPTQVWVTHLFCGRHYLIFFFRGVRKIDYDNFFWTLPPFRPVADIF